jgi:predicted transcriptional regulator
MAIRDLAASRGASTLIFDPKNILELAENNTRDMESPSTKQHIREMADAIIKNGNEQFPPITIYQEGDKIYVMAGWCRRRAHILAMEEGAPIKGILCLSTTRKKPEDITLSILSSNDGLPLTASEKAKAVIRLQSYLWTPADIAEKLGWSVTTINNLIDFYNAPNELRDLVNNGQVSATLAMSLLKEKGAEGALEVLRGAIETSKQAGKKKATKKDLDEINKKKVPWKTYGPKLYKIMQEIYEVPASEKNLLFAKIASGGELLAEIDDKYESIPK